MKNRLVVARELLSEDGAIYISIDDKEQAYLKILLDEIFGKDNFLTQFNFQVRYADKSIATETMAFKPLIEYTLMYAKTILNLKLINLLFLILMINYLANTRINQWFDRRN